jgi:hypothetical protein
MEGLQMSKQRKPTGVSTEGGFLDNVHQKEIDNIVKKADSTEQPEPKRLNDKQEKDS